MLVHQLKMKIPKDVLSIVSDFTVFSNEEKFMRERFYLIIHGDLTKDDFCNAYHNSVRVTFKNDTDADLKDYFSSDTCYQDFSYHIHTDKTYKVHSKDHRYITEIEVIRLSHDCDIWSNEILSQEINKNFDKYKNASEYIEHMCDLMLGLLEEYDLSFENLFVEGKRRQAYRTFLSHQKIVDTLDKCISRNR